jgi:hypothetical protein
VTHNLRKSWDSMNYRDLARNLEACKSRGESCDESELNAAQGIRYPNSLTTLALPAADSASNVMP